MDKELVREIIASGSALLKDFAHAAKTTGEHVYSVLVHQQYVEGIGNLVIVCVLALTGFFLVYPLSKKMFNWATKNDNYGDHYMGATFGTMGLIILTLILVLVLGDAVKHLLNPEYYALQTIFDTVKPK
mgnify:CR=1 FL=1